MQAALPWLQLLACALVIGFAGTALSRYGDVIARRTGLGGGWIGMVLVASVTSLPELVTGISSVTVAQTPDIAVGNVLGACVLNLAMIAVLDVMHRSSSIYTTASQGHAIGAGFTVVMLGAVSFALVAEDRLDRGLVAHVGYATPVLALLYAVAIRTVFHYERASLRADAGGGRDEGGPTLRQAAARYAVAAAAVVACAVWLPFVAGNLADAMGWRESFVGTLLVAATTTLPELAVTISAVRIGALDMAVGNLVGSNLFNLFILAIDDLLYLPGSLLAAVAHSHLLSAASASMMGGALVVALVARPQARLLNLAGWTSVLLALVYFANAWLDFRAPA